MNESYLRQKMVKLLRTIDGVWVYKVSDAYTSGIPDIILCCRGRFIAIELKAEHGKMSHVQLAQQKIIERCDGLYYTVYPDKINKTVDDIRLLAFNEIGHTVIN